MEIKLAEEETQNTQREHAICFLFDSIVKIRKLHDYQTLEIHEVREGFWAFFLDCAFRTPIGWGDKLRSHGLLGKYRSIVGRRVSHVHSPLFLPDKMPSLAVHSSGKFGCRPAKNKYL